MGDITAHLPDSIQEFKYMLNLTGIQEVGFEERDLQIFNIPDTKTKLSVLQNYFFPRLEILLRYTLDIVADVYQLNPYERMTFVYRPNHRPKAKENLDFDEVHIGVGAKRSRKPLQIFKRNGKPFCLHPTYLTFKILPTGKMYVELLPFAFYIDDAYIQKISSLIENNNHILLPLLSLAHISHRSNNAHSNFLFLHHAIKFENKHSLGIRIISHEYSFPIDVDRELYKLVFAFILLYALTESFIQIGEGKDPELYQMLQSFKKWYIKSWYLNMCMAENQIKLDKKENHKSIEIPELDSYSFIRAGRWWDILARDKWTCLSCGRSARKDGVVLEVDHIIPRSKGGSDDKSNLQTLCKKCNIGKSNRDSTRLSI